MNLLTLKIATCLAPLILTIFVGCQTQTNLARSLVNSKCADLGIPNEIIVRNSEKLSFEGRDFVLKLRYNYSISYSKKLAGCITAYQCSQKQSDRLHECNKQRSFFRELVFGNDSCDLPEIDC